MARMRIGIRTTTTTALALAALATPAAATPTRNQDDRPARVGFAGLQAWSEARAPQHDSGPVLPLIGKHEGQDILAPAGTPLVAATDGVIAETGSDGSEGNYVYLHERRRDRTYVYMHMIAPAIVGAGDEVNAGERLGAVGCTGSCWGDHLHFEIREGRGIGGQAHDPLPMLKRWKSVDEPR